MKLKNILLTAAISLSALITTAPKADAQLALLSLWYQGDSYGIKMSTSNVAAKPYGGILSWLDIAFAQAYGITYDECNATLGGYTKPDNYQYRFHLYSNNGYERTHTLSCGKARELVSTYGATTGRRVHYGSNYTPYVSTLSLDSDWEATNFRQFRQTITLGATNYQTIPNYNPSPKARGRCVNPNDLDIRGRKCGGRASSVNHTPTKLLPY